MLLVGVLVVGAAIQMAHGYIDPAHPEPAHVVEQHDDKH
jgi:hypothetical protein